MPLLKSLEKYPLFPSIRRNIGWFALGIALASLAAVFNGISVTMTAPILMALLGLKMEMVGMPKPILKIMELTGLSSASDNLGLATAFVFGAVVFKNASVYAGQVASSYAIQKFVLDVRERLIKLLVNSDMAFFTRSNPSALANSVVRDIDSAAEFFKNAMQVLAAVLSALTLMTILMMISWQLTLVSIGVMTIVGLSSQSTIAKSRAFGARALKQEHLLSNSLHQVFNGIALVKSSTSEASESARLTALVKARCTAMVRAWCVSTSIMPLGEIYGVAALLGIVWFARFFFISYVQGFSAVLLTFLFILFRLLPQLNVINGMRGEMNRHRCSVDLISDLLRSENKQLVKNGTIEFTGLKDGITFEAVSFAYGPNENLSLQDVSFTIPKGKRLALVGHSGSGKTTCAELLLRFYDPTKGTIFIDDCNLQDYEISSVRKSIGVVSQDTYLFNDTVRYNIKYARPSATDAEMIEAARISHALDFIEKLPDKFDTEIGERGVRLSGGEKQRLAIARTLLLNPEILILDEATSALDSISEQLIQEVLDNLLQDRTTLVIAHRLSTIRDAHSILVMNNGRVVESGSHADLLQLGGHFSKLYQMQFSWKRSATSDVPIIAD